MPGLQDLNPYIAGAEAAGGLLSGITGLIQKHKANKMLKALQFPTEEMPSDITENKLNVETMANQGLPSEQYQMAMRNIQRQQMNALRAASDRRGGLATVGTNQQATDDAMLGLDVANSKQRVANQQNLYNVNSQVAGWKSKLFDANVRQKYLRDYQYAMGLLGAGNQNLVGGLDKITGGAALFGAEGGFQGKHKPTTGYQFNLGGD